MLHSFPVRKTRSVLGRSGSSETHNLMPEDAPRAPSMIRPPLSPSILAEQLLVYTVEEKGAPCRRLA